MTGIHRTKVPESKAVRILLTIPRLIGCIVVVIVFGIIWIIGRPIYLLTKKKRKPVRYDDHARHVKAYNDYMVGNQWSSKIQKQLTQFNRKEEL